jgi:hypothetical protein
MDPYGNKTEVYYQKQRRPQSKKKKRGKTEARGTEGMPQDEHYPLAKRRGDRNPKYHEEQQKDVAYILAVYPLKKRRKVVRRTKCCIRT